MSTPPRRRRPDTRRSPDGGGWLPTIAMGLGVVVAGLAIGALVAVLMQRSGGKPPHVGAPVAVVTSTAAPSAPPGRAPVAMAPTQAPITEPPSPSPSPSTDESPEPSPSPSVSPTERPTARPAPTVRPHGVVRASEPSAAPRAVAAAPQTTAAAVPARVAPVTPPPSPGGSAQAPAAPAGPTPAPATSEPSESTSVYDEHASAVVRRYIDALIRGDDKTAYAALGGGGTLTEQAFIDPGSHIVSLKVTRIDAANASVGCEIASAKGHYYATYHVTAATSGPYIAEHDYIKV